LPDLRRLRTRVGPRTRQASASRWRQPQDASGVSAAQRAPDPTEQLSAPACPGPSSRPAPAALAV